MANRPMGARGGRGADPRLAEPFESTFEPGEQTRPLGRRLQGAGWPILLDAPVLVLLLGLSLLLSGNRSALFHATDPASFPAWPLALSLVPSSLALSATFGLYRTGILRSRRRQAAAGARALVWSAALAVGGVFLLSEEIPGALRLLILLYHGTLAVWLLGARPLLLTAVRSRAYRGAERILILGGGASALHLARGLTARARGATRIVTFADDHPPEVQGLKPFRITDIGSLAEVAEEVRADQVVVARDDIHRDQIVRISDALLVRGIRVKVLSNMFDRLIESIPFESIHGLRLLQVGETPLGGKAWSVKRSIDLFGAIVGGILILPFLVGIALAIRLTSRGPILYTQTRIGRAGRPFTFYKFRSMVVHEPDEKHRRYLTAFLKNGAAASIDGNGNKVYKLADDPRVTTVGRFLRRTSLDELPQLWNVLRGEMSLVGPRPCLPFEYELYDEWQRRRLHVTPGMTGLWQVTGRSYVTFNDMVLLDLFYIGNWSLGLDAKLLLRTLPVILFGKGGL